MPAAVVTGASRGTGPELAGLGAAVGHDPVPDARGAGKLAGLVSEPREGHRCVAAPGNGAAS